jgi:hypothetical protein
MIAVRVPGLAARHALAMTGRQYRLTVEGEFSGRVRPAFAGMTLTRAEGRTVLVGVVRDQAELHGILQRISDLGLTMLSASAVDEDD